MWLGAESNRRHVDFQSTALPTELPSRDCANYLAPWDVHYAANQWQGNPKAFGIAVQAYDVSASFDSRCATARDALCPVDFQLQSAT